MEKKQYQIKYTYGAKEDIHNMRMYILDKFKYYQNVTRFTNKIKKAVNGLKIFPKGYSTTNFVYRGYFIFMKPSHKYLIFYIVNDKLNVVTILRIMRDGMNWRLAMKFWLKKSNNYSFF